MIAEPSGRPDAKLVEIVLDDASIGRSTPDVEHERAVAIYDLIEQNVFEPLGHDGSRPAPKPIISTILPLMESNHFFQAVAMQTTDVELAGAADVHVDDAEKVVDRAGRELTDRHE